MSNQQQQKSISIAHFSFANIGKWLLLCVISSAMIGSAAAGFLQSLQWITNYRESHHSLIYFLPIAGLLIGLAYHYFGKQIERGNNLLLESIENTNTKIPFRMAPFIYLSTLITHLFGGSAGREGTALQMAGSLVYSIIRPFQFSAKEKSILLVAAIAGGFGAVFGTPLAGVFFALEITRKKHWNVSAILPCLIVALLANQVTILWQIPHTHYSIQNIPTISFLSVAYSILAGIIFGLVAYLFKLGMAKGNEIFKKIPFPPFRPFIGGIILVALIIGTNWYPYIGLGIPTIEHSFTEPVNSGAFAIKILLTVLTLTAGFKGGEVTPLFFIGATLGNAMALYIPLPMDLLAGMGFVAVFAGATNAPIACIFLAYELFDVPSFLFTSIACIAAYLFSGKMSIYSKQHFHLKKIIR